MKKALLVAVLVAVVWAAQARETYGLNGGWRFFTRLESDSVAVALPHCWAADYVGTGNYVRYVNIPQQWATRRVFLCFGAAGTVAVLFVNGRYVGEHRGGGVAFGFEITGFVNFGTRNLVQVVVSNVERADVLPTASVGVQWGGLYRSAELVVADGTVIGMDDAGSDGVTVRVARVSDEAVSGNVVVRLNSGTARGEVDVSVVAPDGTEAFRGSHKVTLVRGVSEVSVPFSIQKPQLWGGIGRANLYTVRVRTGEDEVEVRTGFRYFAASVTDGFLLNGEPYPLRGVVLYRDRMLRGGAASREELARDLDIISEMGANAIRVAEGAYSQEFYELCDERGIVVMSDLPFVGEPSFLGHGFYASDEFKAAAGVQFREQILQFFNHPSILFWTLFVTPTLRGNDPIPFIAEMNRMVKSLDGQRFTVGISNRDGELNTITDLVVWAQILGWTEGAPADVGLWQNQLWSNRTWSKIRSAVGYMAGGEVATQANRLRRPDPNSSFHPENWQTFFHQTYLRVLGADRRFWALWVGTMFDFRSQSAPSGAVAGMTDYGLVSVDRTVRKDAYYLYKAAWARGKFVYIAGRRNGQRVDNQQDITIFSSCDSVTLTVNGAVVSTIGGNGGVFVWEKVHLQRGVNRIQASGDGDLTDEIELVVMNYEL